MEKCSRPISIAAAVLCGLTVTYFGVAYLRSSLERITPSDKVRVLYVDGSPCWEFKYLKNVLLRRSDFRAQCFLLGDDTLVERTPDAEQLTVVPVDFASLRDFDVIILGDVPETLLSAGFRSALWKYVRRAGGSLVFLSRGDTARQLSTICPVALPDTPGASNGHYPFPARLTEAGRKSKLLRVGRSPSENTSIWEQAPPFHSARHVKAAKDHARVLAVDPTRVGVSGPMPLIVYRRFGRGHALYIGTSELWRWRGTPTGSAHDRLWAQIITSMARHDAF